MANVVTTQWQPLATKRNLVGHELEQRPGNYYAEIQCSCGNYATTVRLKTDGMLDSRANKTWEAHLDQQSTPSDIMIEVGKVIKKRSTQTVLVFTREHPNINEWMNGRHGHWIQNYPGPHNYWVVGVEVPHKNTPTSRTIKSTGISRQSVIEAALKYMRGQEESGFEVINTIPDPTQAIIVKKSSSDSVSDLLTDVDKCLAEFSLREAQNILRELDAYIRFGPAIQLKRQELQTAIHDNLTNLLR